MPKVMKSISNSQPSLDKYANLSSFKIADSDPVFLLLPNSANKAYYSGTLSSMDYNSATTEFSETNYNRVNSSDDERFTLSITSALFGSAFKSSRYTFNFSKARININNILNLTWCWEGYFYNTQNFGRGELVWYRVSTSSWVTFVSSISTSETTYCLFFDSSNISSIYDQSSGLIQFGAGIYASTIPETGQRTTSYLYTDYVNLTINYVDKTPPQYSLISTNSTLGGTPVMHSLFWEDEGNLSHAIFSFDNCTGRFQNISIKALTGSSDWSNFTVIINDTPGCTIRWRVYANDSFNNWNASEIFTYTTFNPYLSNCSLLSQSGVTYYLTNNIFNSTAETCMEIEGSDIILDCQGHTIDGVGTSNSYGISASLSSNITIRNCTVTEWYFGIALYSVSNSQIINSKIASNSYGIYISGSSNNLIYNNLLNNSNNVYFGTVEPNYWNTTKQLGTRIYWIGDYIGGNYWTNPVGKGYSDTCNDTDCDGFCDNPYSIASNNIDFLPLSYLGVIELDASYLPSYLEVVQGKTFWINVSAKCKGKSCKDVYGLPRYNFSSEVEPDKDISTDESSKPFFIQEISSIPFDYNAEGGFWELQRAFDGDMSSDGQVYSFTTQPVSEVNFTFYIPSREALLFVYTQSLLQADGVAMMRIYNFSSNSWYIWKTNFELDNYTLLVDDFSGLISSKRNLILNFYTNFSGDSGVNLIRIYETNVSFHPIFCGDLDVGKLCNLSWKINATGDYYTTWLVDGFFNSSTAYSNNTLNSLIRIIPGIVNETKLTSPPDGTSITRYTLFTLEGKISCKEGNCGQITAKAMYNSSSPLPDTEIGYSGSPFYILSYSNPCPPSLREGESCTISWVLNATGEKYTFWKLGIIFNSSLLGEYASNNVTVRIIPKCSELPTLINGKLRVKVECEGKYYSFAKTDEVFELPIKFEVNLTNVSLSIKNLMIGFGNGALDEYGRPENSFVFEFNETHVRFFKYESFSGEELGSMDIPIFPLRLEIEMNSLNATFKINGNRFEFPFSSSIASWYFFVNAYNSKDTVADIDDLRIRKYVPSPSSIFWGSEEKIEIKRIGLASLQEKPNLLSLEKIKRLNETCSSGGYNSVRTILGLSEDFYLLVKRIEDGLTLLACGLPQSGKPFAYIERIVAFDDGTYGKFELSVWK